MMTASGRPYRVMLSGSPVAPTRLIAAKHFALNFDIGMDPIPMLCHNCQALAQQLVQELARAWGLIG
jgi:hypothetical protein